jgi:hypothetical protein
MIPASQLATAPPLPADEAGSVVIGPPVSVDDLLARDVPLHWSEAVAIVGQLCEVLTGDPASDARIPHAAEILITAGGGVIVRDGSRGDCKISTLGRSLQDLLAASNPPAPLRLFALHSISSESYTSVEEFAKALSFYERPNRTELIQTVHRRFHQTTASADRPRAERPKTEEEEKPAPPKASRRRLPAWAVVAAAVLVCAAAAGIWFHVAPESAASPEALRSLVARATTAVQQFGADVGQTLGVVVRQEKTAPVETPPAKPRSRRVRQASAQGVLRSRPLIDQQAAVVFAAPAVGPAAPLVPVRAVEEASVPPEPGAPVVAVGREEGPAIYSSEAVDVQPPIWKMPQLPRVPVSGPYATNTMELLIGENGVVQQVKLLSPLRRLPDVMLLSSAKHWEFGPAMKDGRPVKYRLRLDWTVTPR